MRAFLSILAAIGACQLLAACSTWHSLFGNDDNAKPTTEEVIAASELPDADTKSEVPSHTAKSRVKAGPKDEQELKMARLWARIDALEEEALRNKERIRVLEKGITLGLVPEELKGGAKKNVPIVKEPLYDNEPATNHTEDPPSKAVKLAKSPKVEKTMGDESAEHSASENPPPPAASEAVSSADHERYQAALASAHDLFRAGRYGRAIVEYDRIGKDFAGKVEDGMHKYWIGKCWSNLKEYNTARQILTDFITENASSPWIPRAKLELARVEWKLGLQDTSLQRFKEIIKAYPYEDAAEMAKMELENLGKTL